MNFKNIAVLTSQESWILEYKDEIINALRASNHNVKLFFNHEDISSKYEIVFILSYFKIIPEKYLIKHKHNLVVHESELPKGKGWSPLFWQILEGKNKIPIVLFEAASKMDNGQIYFKDYVDLIGNELNKEIRKKQVHKTIELCVTFLSSYKTLTLQQQKGMPTYYKKRTEKDSELDINKSIKEQFNLLRIVNNRDYPAFFSIHGKKYILNIFND
ncbi:MAG: methionyl-tRNA formyltransferase [bacterium]|nr:methionyl-tRNA formyltransferase [bacterium]